MLVNPTTRYRYISTLTPIPVVFEGGKPIIVHGVILTATEEGNNAFVNLYEGDGSTIIQTIYVGLTSIDTPTELDAPFLADKGFSIGLDQIIGLGGPANATVFYSHIGG